MYKEILICMLLYHTLGAFNLIQAKGRPLGSKITASYNVVWTTPCWMRGSRCLFRVRCRSQCVFRMANNAFYDEDSRLLKLEALRITLANEASMNLALFKLKLVLALSAIFINAASKKARLYR